MPLLPNRRVLVRVAAAASAAVCVLVLLVYALSEVRLHRTYPAPQSLPAPSPALASRGAELARSRGCADCHGERLDGKTVIDEMPFARIVGTALGPRQSESPQALHARIYRALHHGVDTQGRSLLMMPSAQFASLSRNEIEAIAAHVAGLPRVGDQRASSTLGPLGRALLVAGKLEGFLPAEVIDHDVAPIAIEPAPGSIAHGQRLAQLCTGCHQPNLAGGRMSHGGPSAPPASNLTPGNVQLAAWSREDFIHAMRTGDRPDGTPINGRYMPWRAIGQSTHEELDALWRYLKTVPPATPAPQN